MTFWGKSCQRNLSTTTTSSDAVVGKADHHLAGGGLQKGQTSRAPKEIKAVMWKGKHLIANMMKDPTGKQGSSVTIINPYLDGNATTNTMNVHIEEIPPLKSPHPAHRHTIEAILII